MVSCTVFDEMNQLFISLCMISLSKNLYPEIQKYFDKLDNAISISSEKFNVDLEYLPELDEEHPNSLGMAIHIERERLSVYIFKVNYKIAYKLFQN